MIVSSKQFIPYRTFLKRTGLKVVFTNGCFDLLHPGHIMSLEEAAVLGDRLVVGLNSDESVRKLKGAGRPYIEQEDRAFMLDALRAVDFVIIFDEDEPKKLIEEIIPDVLVKGADWAHYVSGREVVENNGGRVVLFERFGGISTSEIIEKIKGS